MFWSKNKKNRYILAVLYKKKTGLRYDFIIILYIHKVSLVVQNGQILGSAGEVLSIILEILS